MLARAVLVQHRRLAADQPVDAGHLAQVPLRRQLVRGAAIVAAVDVERLGDIGHLRAFLAQQLDVEPPVAGHLEAQQLVADPAERGPQRRPLEQHAAGVQDQVALAEATLHEGGPLVHAVRVQRGAGRGRVVRLVAVGHGRALGVHGAAVAERHHRARRGVERLHQPFQQPRVGGVVGLGDPYPIAPGLGRGTLPLPEHRAGVRGARHHADLSVPFRRRGASLGHAVVGRCVVEHDHLQHRMALREDRGQALAHVAGIVVAGHHHRDPAQRRLGQRQQVGHVAAEAQLPRHRAAGAGALA